MGRLTKKMKVKDKNGVRKVTQSVLRSGGMQGRLYRQEIIRYGLAVEKHKKKLRQGEPKRKQGISAQAFRQELDNLKEPVFKRIRTRWGFSDE